MTRIASILILLMSVTALAAPQTKPATAPANAPASTPKEALRSLNTAQRDGDAAAIRSLFVAPDAQGKQLIDAMADYAAALVTLHNAAARAYGVDGANLITGDLQAESAKGLAAIEKADVAIDGNSASVKYAGATDAPIKLVKIDGRWELPVTQLLDGADTKAEEKGTRELAIQNQIARAVADEITAGKYHEGANKAREAWRSRLLDPSPTTRKAENAGLK